MLGVEICYQKVIHSALVLDYSTSIANSKELILPIIIPSPAMLDLFSYRLP